MQYKVPQNVDMEDRVIGPLSLRQFMIILIGVAIVGILYVILQGPLRIFFFLFGILILGSSFAVALGNYGGQNAEEFLFSVLSTLQKPMARVWKKNEEIPQVVKHATTKRKEAIPNVLEKKNVAEARSDLERLAEIVDAGGHLEKVDAKSSQQSEALNDLLQSTEGAKTDIDKILDAAEKKAPKREPLVSEEAKLSPKKEFSYPQIKVSDRSFLN